MFRCVLFSCVVLPTVMFCSPLQADEYENVSCTIKIGVSTYYPNTCRLLLSDDTTYLEWSSPRFNWVQFFPGSDGRMYAYWNGPNGGSHAQTPIGFVDLRGNCWVNDKNEICYTRPVRQSAVWQAEEGESDAGPGCYLSGINFDGSKILFEQIPPEGISITLDVGLNTIPQGTNLTWRVGSLEARQFEVVMDDYSGLPIAKRGESYRFNADILNDLELGDSLSIEVGDLGIYTFSLVETQQAFHLYDECLAKLSNASSSSPIMGDQLADDQNHSGGNEGSLKDGLALSLRSAFDNVAGAEGLTCFHSDEDANRPGARIAMRGTALSDYTGHVPKKHEFWLGADGSLKIDGAVAETLYHEGKIVAARLHSGMPKGRLPGTFTKEEQRSWAQAQEFLGSLVDTLAEQTGLADRVYVLDFGKRQALIATLIDQSLTEQQPIQCE